MKAFPWLGLLVIGSLCTPGRAAQDAKHAPAPIHVKAGLSCFRCHHEEAPTKAPASDEACVDCHGDAPAVAVATQKLPVNPHNPPAAKHTKTFACTECHCQHKPTVVKCLECHDKFKMKAK